MKPKDMFGNEINEGDLVVLKLGSEMIAGRAKNMHESGLEIPGRGKTQPRFDIEVSMTITYKSGKNIGTLIKTIDPEQQKMVESMMKPS